MIRVLICDDHLIVRQGIRMVLADAAEAADASEGADAAEPLLVVAEAANGSEALAHVRAGGVDVVLLDIALPQRDGLDILRQLKSEAPKLPVLMLSTYPDRQYAVRSLKLGAAGYLNKSADAEQMVHAIRRVARGGLFITPSVAELLAGALAAPGGPGADDKPLQALLSHREYQVLRLLAAGSSVGEIAEQLVLAPNTVSTYRARILEKTGVRNDVELALLALRQALL